MFRTLHGVRMGLNTPQGNLNLSFSPNNNGKPGEMDFTSRVGGN